MKSIAGIGIVTISVGVMIAIAPLKAIALGRIIEADGDVSVRQNGESDYEPVSIGTIIETGDLIWPERQVNVTVRCLIDNTNWFVPSGVSSGLGVGCPTTTRQFNVRGRGESDFLDFLNQRFIYATQVIGNKPVLRWNPVSNETRYIVQVEPYDPRADLSENVIWEQVVSSTSVRYQGPEFDLSTDYRMVVLADVGKGLQPISSLRFQRVAHDTAAQIKSVVKETESQGLSAEAEAIVLADIYQSVANTNTQPPDDSGLVFDAIPPLEAAVAEGSKIPYIHRLLGDLYLQVRLLDDAERRYRNVLEFAQVVRDGVDRAAAQVGLANIAADKGHRREAEIWLERARVSYTILGDTQQLRNVVDWLDKLYLDN